MIPVYKQLFISAVDTLLIVVREKGLTGEAIFVYICPTR